MSEFQEAVKCSIERIKRDTLVSGAVRVLLTADPHLKARRGAELVRSWQSGEVTVAYNHQDTEDNLPAKPARDSTVRILAPGVGPKRGRGGTLSSRQALLHSLVHIESWAVDLSWDIIARFGRAYAMPREFFDDFVQVAADEGRHFLALEERLREIGSSYGAFPAHDGLWESAAATSDDLLARLAVEHCVHEARGLDVVPQTIARFRSGGDPETADLLEKVIYPEEITHCAAGVKWFSYLCRRALETGDPKTVATESSKNRSASPNAGNVRLETSGVTSSTGLETSEKEHGTGELQGAGVTLHTSTYGEAAEVSAAAESIAACRLEEQPQDKCSAIDGESKARNGIPERNAGRHMGIYSTGRMLEIGSGELDRGDALSASGPSNANAERRSALEECKTASVPGALNEAELKRHVVTRFHQVVRKHFRGPLKPPFNHAARAQAGFDEEWYMPLAISAKDSAGA